jgi:hypothetical protein
VTSYVDTINITEHKPLLKISTLTELNIIIYLEYSIQLLLFQFIILTWNVFTFSDNDEVSSNDLCPEDTNCPEFCYCEAGTVDCSHRGLKEIPLDLPKTTTRWEWTLTIGYLAKAGIDIESRWRRQERDRDLLKMNFDELGMTFKSLE